MLSVMDNTNLQKCRTCLKQGHKLKLLTGFSKFSHTLSISEIFMYCASIQISPNDGCSQYVCSKCVKSAEKAYRFKKQCEHSDKVWNEFKRRLKMKPTLKPVEPNFHDETPETIVRLDNCEIDEGTKTELESVSLNLQETVVLVSTQIPFDDESEADDYQMDDSETKPVEVYNEVDYDPDIKPIEIHEEVKTENFICKHCFTIFGDEAKHSRHELAHTIEPTRTGVKEYAVYGCRGCSVDCETAEDFIEHCEKLHKNSSEELYYRCKLCAGDFANRYRLTVHVSSRDHQNLELMVPTGRKRKLKSLKEKVQHIDQNQKDSKRFSCNKCEETFDSKSSYKQHKGVHKPRTCQHCGKTFKWPSELMKHIKVHSSDTRYKCDQCDESFAHSATLRSHKSIHLSRKLGFGSKNPFECRICHKKYKTRDSLRAHFRTHPGNLKFELPRSATWPQQCQYCPLSLNYLHEKIAHLDQEHSEFKSVSCDKCGKAFFNKLQLKRHVVIHEAVKRHMCQYCGSSFALSSNLNQHIRIHTGEKRFKCDKCDACFSQWASLNTHQSFHVDEKKFECNECHKKFKTVGALRRHTLIHTSDKRYPCHLCSRQLKSPKSLKAHLLSHSNERACLCRICGKGFNRMCTLKLHLQTHTGEKPHVCTICNKRFSQSHCLRMHNASFHKDVKV